MGHSAPPFSKVRGEARWELEGLVRGFEGLEVVGNSLEVTLLTLVIAVVTSPVSYRRSES
jgi:hypothetical protein